MGRSSLFGAFCRGAGRTATLRVVRGFLCISRDRATPVVPVLAPLRGALIRTSGVPAGSGTNLAPVRRNAWYFWYRLVPVGTERLNPVPSGTKQYPRYPVFWHAGFCLVLEVQLML